MIVSIGKTHLSIAIARNCIRSSARVRFYMRRDNQGENSATMKMRKASVCLLGRGA